MEGQAVSIFKTRVSLAETMPESEGPLARIS